MAHDHLSLLVKYVACRSGSLLVKYVACRSGSLLVNYVACRSGSLRKSTGTGGVVRCAASLAIIHGPESLLVKYMIISVAVHDCSYDAQL